MDYQRLYRARFSERDKKEKAIIWEVLCNEFLNKFIRSTDWVLDIGAGYCEFINNIKCGTKYAIDLNEDIREYADRDVQVIIGDCKEMQDIPDKKFDVAFMSNFLEHMNSKDEIEAMLINIKSKLRDNGILVILQPNIKYFIEITGIILIIISLYLILV